MKRIIVDRYWVLLVLGVVIFLAICIFLLDVVAPQKPFVLIDFLRNMAVSTPFALLIAFADFLLVRYINNSKWLASHRVIRVIFEVAALVALAVVFVIIGNIPFWKENYGFADYLSSSPFYVSATTATLINFFTVTIIEYFTQIKKNQELQKENLAMQYKQLKSQINPHFLFNSLNVLVSLINKDSSQAVKYTHKLSDIYRYVLTQDEKSLIYVADEICFIKTYIDILRIRYGDALKCEINVDDASAEKLIPPMSLQLLIENAVKHNTTSAKKPLTISITNDSKYLVVSNNINPRITVEDSTGIGLQNLAKKFKIISEHNIIFKKDNQQFTVKLPLI